MTIRKLFALVGIFAMVSIFAARPAQTQPANDSSARCTALGATDFSQIQDAPTQVMEAKLIEAKDGLPAHCAAQGYVTPNVGIELLLPENWNGKFIEVGCGGFCGVIATSFGACNDALSKGYACIASDQGHRGTVPDAKWAYNNLQAEVDYAYRATHVAALAGKAIAERYYSTAPRKSYFMGCSGGGRQALVAAQRFPFDFDGIVAMDPGLNLSSIFVNLLWNALAVRTTDGKSIFTEKDVNVLHDAVVARCDLNDGIKDGLIGDPRACRFDPAELSCQNGKQACLTPTQVEAAKKVYAGATTSAGEKITHGGAMLGSEVGGIFGISAFLPGPQPLSTLPFAADFFRYMGFSPDPGPHWQAKDFDFDRDYKRLGMMEALYASTDPDLRRFKARGGKLILTQGWHDGGSPLVGGSIDYYETVEKTMGGRASTTDFFRLFMVPGRNHCGGGEGAWAIDHLAYLDAWVERDQAPDSLIGAHPKEEKAANVRFPLPPEGVAFSRPVYPYPAYAHYKGKGDPNTATSFEPRNPAAPAGKRASRQ